MCRKALKAFLLFKDIEPPKIHDLNILCKMCQDIDCSFSDIKDSCARLTPYGVMVRYPNELAVDEVIAKAVIDKAQQVYSFCFEKVGSGINF